MVKLTSVDSFRLSASLALRDAIVSDASSLSLMGFTPILEIIKSIPCKDEGKD